MDNILLLNCLESVLGKGKKSSSGNYAFNCPFCNHHKPKLEVKLQTNLKKLVLFVNAPLTPGNGITFGTGSNTSNNLG